MNSKLIKVTSNSKPGGFQVDYNRQAGEGLFVRIESLEPEEQKRIKNDD